MFAVMPISSPQYVKALRPDPAGSHGGSVVDVALIAIVAASVLLTMAPSVALAIAVVAGITGIAWIGLRVAASAPQMLIEAHRDAVARAAHTQISFAR
jgi:hypothetical protein